MNERGQSKKGTIFGGALDGDANVDANGDANGGRHQGCISTSSWPRLVRSQWRRAATVLTVDAAGLANAVAMLVGAGGRWRRGRRLCA